MLGIMKNPGKFIALSVIATMVVGVAACWHIVTRYEHAFETTTNGETFSLVVERFGEPSVVEYPAQPFLRYATKGCSSPCAVRVWWEHPVLKDIEAWSVEFNDKGQVIDTAHWLSP